MVDPNARPDAPKPYADSCFVLDSLLDTFRLPEYDVVQLRRLAGYRKASRLDGTVAPTHTDTLLRMAESSQQASAATASHQAEDTNMDMDIEEIEDSRPNDVQERTMDLHTKGQVGLFDRKGN